MLAFMLVRSICQVCAASAACNCCKVSTYVPCNSTSNHSYHVMHLHVVWDDALNEDIGIQFGEAVHGVVGVHLATPWWWRCGICMRCVLRWKENYIPTVCTLLIFDGNNGLTWLCQFLLYLPPFLSHGAWQFSNKLCIFICQFDWEPLVLTLAASTIVS